jgi:beta-glucosidase/6-phospho-beta-glucosidase/beta-galactosidase
MNLGKAIAQKAYHDGRWDVLASLSKNKQNPWWFVDEIILGDYPEDSVQACSDRSTSEAERRPS